LTKPDAAAVRRGTSALHNRGARIRAPLSVVGAVLCVTSALAEPRPSFDCAKAKETAEKTICASEALAKQDLAIDQAYQRLRRSLDKKAAAALKDDQASFVAHRDQGIDNPDFELSQRLADRLAFLKSVRPPPKGLIGRWGNVYGEVIVKAGDGSKLDVTIDTVDPTSGRWLCEGVGGRAPLRGGRVSFLADEDDKERGWTIKVSRTGLMLKVHEIERAPAKSNGIRSHCGTNGFVEGLYFPLAPKAETADASGETKSDGTKEKRPEEEPPAARK
jgi:uncharacterized protein